MGSLTVIFFVTVISAVIILVFQNAEIISLDFLAPVVSGVTSLWKVIGLALSRLLSFGDGTGSGSARFTSGEKVLTKEELLTFKYKYLAIAGDVFDVSNTNGNKHYGPEGHYNFFTGIDGTQAFVTGDFTDKGLVDNVDAFDAASIRSIEDWRLKYHKDYTYVGKVAGNFYDSEGKETKAKVKYNALLLDAAKAKLEEKEFNKLYPSCNAEFMKGGSRVWCSDMSGGTSRPWVGVPRKMFTIGTGHTRCVCVRTTGPPSSNMNSKSHENRGDLDNPNLRAYDNCSSSSETCPI